MNLYYKECHYCGKLSSIVNTDDDTYPKNREEAMNFPDYWLKDENDPESGVVDHNQVCIYCGHELVMSPVELHKDSERECLNKKEARKLEKREYYIYKKYIKNDPEREAAFRECNAMKDGEDCEKYWAEKRKRRAKEIWKIVGKVLLWILLFFPYALWTLVSGTFNMIKKDLTDMMNAKGSTIIFCDDCNHHKK